MRISKGGGTATALYHSPTQNGLYQDIMAIDSTSAYVEKGIDIYHQSVMKVAKDGSTAVEIAEPASQSGRSIAIDAHRLYYMTDQTGGVESVPLNGGTVTTVIDPNGPKPTELGTGAEVPFGGLGINGLISDGTNLYYATSDHLLVASVGGGTPRILASNANAPGNLKYVGASSWPVVTGGMVYWNYFGSVFATPITGSSTTPTTLVSQTSSGSGPETVTDGEYLYYLDRGLQKVSIHGGKPTELVFDAGQYNFSRLAIDDTSVYLIASSGQSIVKVPK